MPSHLAKHVGLAVTLVAGTLLLPALAHAQSDQWTFSLTPYLWLPNVDGTLKYEIPSGAGGRPSVEVGPNNYLENLSFALMLAGEARKGKWSILTDLVYLDFNSEKSAVKSVDFVNVAGSPISSNLEAGTQTSLRGGVWTLVAGYAAVQAPGATLDVIGGFRYFDIKASTDWRLSAVISGPGPGQVFSQSGNVSQREDLWDAIVGVRGRMKLGSNWSLPYYIDVGTGSSELTWQAVLGVSCGFGWGDLTLAYRHLSYRQDNDKLIQDLRFSGPALGGTFRF